MSKVLACLTVLLLASAGVALAQGANTPDNPNCTQGVRGCQNYYATTDHSDDNPLAKDKNSAGAAADHLNDNAAKSSYPTTDHSDDNPLLHPSTTH